LGKVVVPYANIDSC